MRILIDPGHGGNDVGTRDPTSGLTESYANYMTALTLRYLLDQEGFNTFLTRIDDRRVPLSERTKIAPAELFISVHYDWPAGQPMIYYASNHGPSRQLGFAVGLALGMQRIWPTSKSQFGRLYIDDFPPLGPALLWEVDTIDKYQPTREYRLGRCTTFVAALVKELRV